MHMDSLYVPMFGHHVCPRRSAEVVRSCVIRATARRELLRSSKKQAWVPWKNKLSSSSLCSLSSLVLVFFYWKSKRPVSEPQERRLQAVSRLLELRDQELWLAERYAMYVRLLSL